MENRPFIKDTGRQQSLLRDLTCDLCDTQMVIPNLEDQAQFILTATKADQSIEC